MVDRPPGDASCPRVVSRGGEREAEERASRAHVPPSSRASEHRAARAEHLDDRRHVPARMMHTLFAGSRERLISAGVALTWAEEQHMPEHRDHPRRAERALTLHALPCGLPENSQRRRHLSVLVCVLHRRNQLILSASSRGVDGRAPSPLAQRASAGAAPSGPDLAVEATAGPPSPPRELTPSRICWPSRTSGPKRRRQLLGQTGQARHRRPSSTSKIGLCRCRCRRHRSDRLHNTTRE